MELFLLRFLLLATLATPALADDQVWLAGTVEGPISGRLITWTDVQTRFTNGGDRLGQLVVRPSLGIALKPGDGLYIGYAFFDTYPEGGTTRKEHRFWQQAQLRVLGTPGKAVLVSRTRLEQRFAEGEDETGWRLRQFTRGQVWVGNGWSLIGFNEAFAGLNETPFQPDGLSQLRNFVGVGKVLAPQLTLEVGYLNQRMIRPGSDATNNIASFSLFYRLR